MNNSSRKFEGIFVNGRTMWSIIDGMDVYKYKGVELLEKGGIMDLVPDENHWYPLDQMLNVLKWIEQELGYEILFSIGTKIPLNAKFPDYDNDTPIEDILADLDNVYHLNHKKGEKIMFDPQRPPGERLIDGIGHYIFQRSGERKGKMICTNPYPCDFDMGILYSLLSKRSEKSNVEHERNFKCRKKGDDRCVYSLSW